MTDRHDFMQRRDREVGEVGGRGRMGLSAPQLLVTDSRGSREGGGLATIRIFSHGITRDVACGKHHVRMLVCWLSLS